MSEKEAVSVSRQIPSYFVPAVPDGRRRCRECAGHGVRWTNEKEPTGMWPDGKLFCKGWMELCPECKGEGSPEKKDPFKVDFCVGKSISLHEDMIPYDFARNTPENMAWKLGTEKTRGHSGEAAWLASNGMLLIVHGDRGRAEILERKDCRITPSVEAKYYAWLCPGVITGPHVDLLIEALNEYNRGK